MESNMDLINDMFSTELEYHTDIESGQTKSYYLGKMHHFLSEIPSDYYYDCLQVFCENIPTLTNEQKEQLVERWNLPQKERIVYRETKVSQKGKSKPKLNRYDDY